MKKEFVEHASHELKTPLTIIQGYAETLQDLAEGEAKPMVGKILENCQRMNGIVSGLLRLTDIENSKLKLEELSLYPVLEDCCDQIQRKYPDVKIAIEGECSPIQGDSALLQMAFINLLDNSAKYGNEISVNLEGKSVTIRDNGKGIPKEELDRVFERFYSVNKQESRKFGGAGLGLSLVKIIVEKHGSTLTLESELGKGTTVTIQM